MRGDSLSGTTVIGTTLLRLALMCHLLRGTLTGLSFSDLREDLEVVTCKLEVGVTSSNLEVQLGDLEVVSCMKVMSSDLKVGFSNLVVGFGELKVVSDLEVVTSELQVVACMKSHLAVVLSPTGWTAHVFTVMVFVPPRSIGASLLILS